MYEQSEPSNVELSAVKLTGQEAVFVPARTTKVVFAHVRRIQINPGKCLVVESTPECSPLPHNIVIAPICVNIDYKFGKVPVQVTNLGDEDTWIQARSKLGVLRSVEEIPSAEVSDCVGKAQIAQHSVPDGLKIDSLNLLEEEAEQFRSLVSEHSSVFSKGDEDLGFTDKVKHSIITTDNIPVKLPHRRIPPTMQNDVKEHID